MWEGEGEGRKTQGRRVGGAQGGGEGGCHGAGGKPGGRSIAAAAVVGWEVESRVPEAEQTAPGGGEGRRARDQVNTDSEAPLGVGGRRAFCRSWGVRSRSDGKMQGGGLLRQEDKDTRPQNLEDLETEAKPLALPQLWAVIVRSLTVELGTST